jgi:hypothetical protein
MRGSPRAVSAGKNIPANREDFPLVGRATIFANGEYPCWTKDIDVVFPRDNEDFFLIV